MKKYLFVVTLFFTFSGWTQTESAEDNCLVVVPKQLVKNNDDNLTIEIDCPVSEFHFKLFNRWGVLLYEAEQYFSPLDFDIHARLKGKRKQAGPEKYQSGSTYIWQLEYREEGSVNLRKSSGQLTIL